MQEDTVTPDLLPLLLLMLKLIRLIKLHLLLIENVSIASVSSVSTSDGQHRYMHSNLQNKKISFYLVSVNNSSMLQQVSQASLWKGYLANLEQ